MRHWRWLMVGLWSAGLAASEVHRCVDARGGIVFQDAPCGVRGPGVQAAPEVARPARPAPPVWIGPRRVDGECLMVSPVLPLLWPEADGTRVPLPEVEGGVRLRLRADAGAVAFGVLLRARRLGPAPPAVPAPPEWPADAVGPPPPPAPRRVDPARLRLHTHLDAHALIIDGGPTLSADNWRSPWELSFGERRSTQVRQAIQKGGPLRLQVGIEGYGTVSSAPLPAAALLDALSAVWKCSRG
ncbi:MAG: DUF4124 domain-containing protein [Xanthomonadales bacterium]|jgi:hypothetical protein|nr:DUF4124 domain-containing protein [Xanthomonadales bacterium]